MSQVLGRILSYFFEGVLVKFLANNRTFQRLAVNIDATHKTVTDVVSKTAKEAHTTVLKKLEDELKKDVNNIAKNSVDNERLSAGQYRGASGAGRKESIR